MATLLMMALKQESQNVFETNNVQPHYCGVGLLKAAFNAHKLILEHKPNWVINLGTAGSHNFKQGSLVECTSFVQRYPNNLFPLKSKILKTAPISKLPQVICGSADFIETSQPLVQCDVMDMEAYALAYVCEQLGVKFNSIKYVSDNSDANLSSQWHSNLQDAALKLFNEYQKIII